MSELLEYYNRFYNLRIGVEAGNSGQFADAIDLSDFRITFDIEKTMNRFAQHAVIRIYNLDINTERLIIERGQQVVLEAGYQTKPKGLIFKGRIFYPLRGVEDNVTHFLELVCIAGNDLYYADVCSTEEAGKTTRQLAMSVTKNSSIPVDMILGTFEDNQTSQRGTVLYGKTRDLIQELAIENDLLYWVDNDQLYMMNFEEEPPPNPPEVNADTGMIGYPVQTQQGIEVRVLINPEIQFGTWIKLNNQDIQLQSVSVADIGGNALLLINPQVIALDGIYRIYRMQITGDTRGDEWYMNLWTYAHGNEIPALLSEFGGVQDQ